MLVFDDGIKQDAQRVVAYGPEGIGKSSLAQKFPDALFIDIERGTSQLDVKRIKRPKDWEALIEVITEIAATPDICKTLVLDTADWAENMAVEHLCDKYKKSGIEEFGYGKGYTYLSEEFMRLLAALTKCIDAGIHVVVLAHAKMRKFEQPDEMGAYDRWEMKLSKNVAPLLKEWSDLLLFCNYKTLVVKTDSGSTKAQGGQRVMYTTHNPCWDAKNRHNLPEEMELNYERIGYIFDSDLAAKRKKKLTDQVQTMLDDSGITAEELQQFVASQGHYKADVPFGEYKEDFLTGWVIKYFSKIVDKVKANKASEN